MLKSCPAFFLQCSESHALDECVKLISNLHKLDLEELEQQQVQRRSSMTARRLSLAEVIPDWPQLHKPKPADKVEASLTALHCHSVHVDVWCYCLVSSI